MPPYQTHCDFPSNHSSRPGFHFFSFVSPIVDRHLSSVRRGSDRHSWMPSMLMLIATVHGSEESYLSSFSKLVRRRQLRLRVEVAMFAMDNFIV